MAKKPTNTRRAKNVPSTPDTKQNLVLAMLRRQSGASIAEIIKATGWQAHSVRGFFAGALKKRLEIEVISEKVDDERRYFVAPLKS